MARKSRYNNSLLTDNYGVGYSKDSLDALMRGQYDQITGRDPKYRTSQEQTQQIKNLPVLEGIVAPTPSVSNDWRSNFSTDRARRNYERRINHVTPDVEAQNLRNLGYEGSFKSFDFDNLNAMDKDYLNAAYKQREDAKRKNATRDTDLLGMLRGEIKAGTPEERQLFLNKYGATYDEVLDAYGMYRDAQERKKREDHPYLTAIGDLPSAFERGVQSAAGWAARTAFPNSDLDRWLNNENSLAKVNEVEKKRDYSRNSSKMSDDEKKLLQMYYNVGDLASSSLTGGLVGGGGAIVNPDTGTILSFEPSKYVAPIAKGVSGYGLGAESKYRELKKRGVSEDKAREAANLAGITEALQSASTIGAGAKEGATILSSLLNGAKSQGLISLGRQAIEEISEKFILGNEGIYDQTVEAYKKNGMPDSEAKVRAVVDVAERMGLAGLGGLVFGGITGAASGTLSKIGNKVAENLDDTLNSVWATQNALPQNDIPRLTGSAETTPNLPGGNLPTLPDNIYPIQMPGTNGVINLPGATPPIQLPDLAARSLYKTAAIRANDGVKRSKPVLPSLIGKGKASSNNGYKVGDNVTYVDNGFEGAGQLPAVVKEVAKDHIVLDVPGLSDHVWLDNDMMDMVSPTSTGASAPTIQSEQDKVNAFMSKKVGRNSSIEMENGQVLEKYSMKEMKSIVKDAKDNGLPEGFQLDIRYKDGSEAYYSSGDDTSNIKMSNIDSVVWRNDSTDAYAGNNVSIYPDDTAVDNAYWRMTLGEAPQNSSTGASVPIEEPSYPWGRTANGMIAEDSYARGSEFRDISKRETETLKAIEDNKAMIKKLRKQLDKEVVGKADVNDINDERVDFATWMDNILSGKKNAPIYSDKGNAIKQEIKNLEATQDDLKNQLSIIKEDRDFIKANARLSQLENYNQNEFVPATKDSYPGFSTTKGALNDRIGYDSKLVEMSPDEYIQRCVYEIFDKEYSPATLESTLQSRNQGDIDQYAQLMRQGVEFDTPYLDYKTHGQEGLHRALAAKEAGIEVMPVVVRGTPNDKEALGFNATNTRGDIKRARLERELKAIDEQIGDIDEYLMDMPTEELEGTLDITPPTPQVPTVAQNPAPAQKELPALYGDKAGRTSLTNSNPEEQPTSEAAFSDAQGYWLRVLGDYEYAIQESQKNGMSVDDYRRIAASNVPGAEVPPPSNVPPTNNVPPTDTPNNGENMRERGMSKHMRGEGKMDVDIPEEVKADFIDNPDMYEQLSNKATSERALKIYNEHPEDRESIFRNMLTQFDPAALPLGNMIAKDYSAAGNHAMAAQIIRDMGEKLTKAGQFSQASIINMLKSDPLTAREYAQRSIDKLNAQGKKEFGKKWNKMSLTKEEMEAFDNIDPGDEEALANLYDQIGQRLGREYPATRLEQLLEGRKVAMLFNVRTVSRNFFANPPTLGMRYIADRIEALGQTAVNLIDPTFEKTQSIRSGGVGRKIAKEFVNSDRYKALVNGVDEKHTVPDLKSEIIHHKQMYKGTAAEKFIDNWMGDVFNRVSDALYNSGKTKSNPHISTPLKEINSRLYGKDEVQSVLETIRNTTYKLLDVTDSPFVKENFVERLGSYLNAQGIKSIDDIPDDAIQVAWNEALKATYKDNSWMVKALKGIKGGMEKIPVIGKPLSQGLIPFVQAPGNIAARMVDYSPINLTKGIAQIVKGAKGKDHETIRKGIEAASKGLTGTGMALLGMALYKSGILTGDYSSDDKEKSFQQRNGFKPWSLNVAGKYFTFNWMQPWAQTLMSGIIAQQAIDNADDFDSDVLRHFGIEGSTAGKIIGAAYMSGKAAYNSWFDEAPLGDFADLFAGTVFNKDVAQNTVDVGKDFAGGMYPATLNALAKTVDITKRNTKDKSNQFSTFVNEQIAKIPFVSKTLPAKYDTWGEEIKNADSKAESAFQRFFYPGEYSSDSTDPIDVEIQRLFKETNDNRVFPFYAADKVGDKTLNNKESSEYQKDMGQRSKAFAEALVNSDRYKEMDDDSRVDTLNQMYYVSKAITERDVFGKPLANSSPYKKYVQAWDEAGGGEKGIQAVVNYSETKAQMKQAGLTSSSKLGKEVLEASKKGDTATVDKITETAKSIDDMGFTKANPKETYVKAKSIDSSITPESFTKTYREIDGADGSKPNEGIKMDEVLAYANKNHLNEQQMNKTWEMFAPSGKQVPYVKKDGTWGKHSPKK